MGQNHPKKLVLSRETVRDLSQNDMANVEGGILNKPDTAGRGCTLPTYTGYPCYTCF